MRFVESGLNQPHNSAAPLLVYACWTKNIPSHRRRAACTAAWSCFYYKWRSNASEMKGASIPTHLLGIPITAMRACAWWVCWICRHVLQARSKWAEASESREFCVKRTSQVWTSRWLVDIGRVHDRIAIACREGQSMSVSAHHNHSICRLAHTRTRDTRSERDLSCVWAVMNKLRVSATWSAQVDFWNAERRNNYVTSASREQKFPSVFRDPTPE